MASRPYALEEILSFDRIKRAITARVLEVAVPALERGSPLDREGLAELIAQEWESVTEAVRSSPAVKEKAREHMDSVVSDLIDGMIQSGRAELESLGVQEKYL